MTRWVANEKGEDEDDDVLPDLSELNHDAEYVIRTWIEHKLHHTYPEPGGYNDQDEYLMDDWHTMNLCYLRVCAGQLMIPAFLQFDGANRPNWRDSGLMDG